VKPGDLVKMTKARIGVPRDSIGLITQCHRVATAHDDMYIFIVQLTKEHPKYGTRTIRRLARDMEVV
jgi:hypothetical protein